MLPFSAFEDETKLVAEGDTRGSALGPDWSVDLDMKGASKVGYIISDLVCKTHRFLCSTESLVKSGLVDL